MKALFPFGLGLPKRHTILISVAPFSYCTNNDAALSFIKLFIELNEVSSFGTDTNPMLGFAPLNPTYGMLQYDK